MSVLLYFLLTLDLAGAYMATALAHMNVCGMHLQVSNKV
jgi:hypothetical protein